MGSSSGTFVANDPWRIAEHAFGTRTSKQTMDTLDPLERLNKEAKRRTKVVGVFPDRASVLRLVGMNLKEIDDDWRAGRHYFQLESMRLLKD